MLGICGIYQDLTGNIQVLLESVPILNKYKSVVKSESSSEDIFKACQTYPYCQRLVFLSNCVCRVL